MLYWSKRQLFIWLRKKFHINKPTALPWGEWSKWDEKTKKEHPIGWFITETLPAGIDWVDSHTIDHWRNLQYYIRNRWHRKTHILPTGLKVGEYYDLDTRILNGLMTSLVNFVEVEKAWMSRWNKDKKYKFKNGRCIQAGLDYLTWEMNLINDYKSGYDDSMPEYGKPTEQAKCAKEIFEIYNWWKNIRPNRPDPYDVSGWSEICENERKSGKSIFDNELTDAEREKSREAIKKSNEIEEQYDAEDNEMIMRLMKIRRYLWI